MHAVDSVESDRLVLDSCMMNLTGLSVIHLCTIAARASSIDLFEYLYRYMNRAPEFI